MRRLILIVAACLAVQAQAAGSSTALAASATTAPPVERPSIMQADDQRHATDSLSFVTAPATGAQAVQPRAQYNNGGLHREVFGFAPYWSLSSSDGSGNLSTTELSDLQYDKLSTIAYFGLTVNSSGGFDNDQGMTAWNSKALTQLVANAHAVGDHVQLVIKQFDEASICAIVSNPAVGQTAISNAISAAQSKGLEGINVDFEGQEETCNGQSLQVWFTNWITSLYQQAHAHGLLLTVDAYSGSASWSGGFFRIDTLAPSVDAFLIMAYDMGLSNAQAVSPPKPDTLPNAPLGGPYTYTDTSSVDQYVGKAGASKVILGVPYYGYKFSTQGTAFNAPQNTSAVTGCNWDCSDPYNDIVTEFPCAEQLHLTWDTASSTPWASWFSPATNDPCGGNHNSWRELYYDNADSLGLKYDLVNNRNIRGAGIWALGYDHGVADLWKPISAKFQCLQPGGGPPGYNILTSFGGIYSFGTALYWGNLLDHGYPGPATGLAETPDGKGYNILNQNGAIYSFGNANYYGNLLDHHYPGPGSALAYTPSGGGYAILTSGGGIYTFGDATYWGNLIDHHYPGTAVGLAYTKSGNGYWILTPEGGIYSFGDAQYMGNLIDHGYPGTAASIAMAKDGNGYGILTTSGALYTFGSQPYLGNLLDHCYPGPAVSFSNTP